MDSWIYYLFFCDLVGGGNQFCRWCLNVLKVEKKDEEKKDPPAGRIIGGLERILISIGALSLQGELILAVIALKTVARYQELDKQISAEYFLIGSLASLSWSILVSGLLLAYDHYLAHNWLYEIFVSFKAK